MKANIEIVDVPALRAALETLKKYENLIEDCIADGGPNLSRIPRYQAQGLVLDALYRIVDDEWRSDETPGGS
jgi:hypothetical protein